MINYEIARERFYNTGRAYFNGVIPVKQFQEATKDFLSTSPMPSPLELKALIMVAEKNDC